MKNLNRLFITSICLFLLLTAAWAQQRADTTQQPLRPPAVQEKPLPEIQLQEYTIVGLAKITLPHKIRAQIFKNVKLQWVPNPDIYQKELPAITFQFSRVKPSLLRLYEFSWLNSGVRYGSFNTAGVDINTQFKINNTLPYFTTDFSRSDGHVDNAQWTSAGLQTGIHQQLKEGHELHVGTNYRFNKNGIWRDADVFRKEWETQSTIWNVFGRLDQQWNQVWQTKLDGTYYLNDHDNALNYSDRGGKVAADILAQFRNTGMEGSAQYQNAKITTANGNLQKLAADTTVLQEYTSSLLSGKFLIRQNFAPVTVRVGVLYQKTNEEFTRNRMLKIDDNFAYPQASVEIGLNGWASASVGYTPGAEIVRLGNLVEDFPFSDFSNFRNVNYTSRWQGALNLDLPTDFHFTVGGVVSRVENYPAPLIAPADSNSATFTATQWGYPGWIFGAIRKVDLTEVQAKMRWQLVRRLLLRGWVNVRHSDIRDSGSNLFPAVGNEIPYFPNLAAQGSLAWTFYRQHEFLVSFDYTGNRYDDLENRVQLDSYFLLNARLNLALSNNIKLFVTGRNLLDTQYDEWKGFPAAGITGYGGFRIVM